MSNAKQRLFEALHSLVGSGELDARLTFAGNAISVLNPEDFPQEYRDAFSDIKDRLFNTVLSSTSDYARRSEDDLCRLSEDVLSLYAELMRGFS